MLVFVLLCAVLGLRFHASPLSWKDVRANMAMFKAATAGDIETVRRLVETSAWTLFSQNEHRMTPLMSAIRHKRLDLIPLLHPPRSNPCFALQSDAVRHLACLSHSSAAWMPFTTLSSRTKRLSSQQCYSCAHFPRNIVLRGILMSILPLHTIERGRLLLS